MTGGDSVPGCPFGPAAAANPGGRAERTAGLSFSARGAGQFVAGHGTYPAALQGHDLVGGVQARTVVGDQERRAAAGGVEDVGDVGEDGGGGVRIESFGGLVEDQDGRVGERASAEVPSACRVVATYPLFCGYLAAPGGPGEPCGAQSGAVAGVRREEVASRQEADGEAASFTKRRWPQSERGANASARSRPNSVRE